MESTVIRTSTLADLLRSVTFAVLDSKSNEPARTGFFFTQDGWGLTARHGAGFVQGGTVTLLHGDEKLTATVQRISREHDAAVLHAPDAKIPSHVPLSNEWSAAERVLVAGYQLQELTSGVNVIEQRIRTYQKTGQIPCRDGCVRKCLILLPAGDGEEVRPGSSGGPLLHHTGSSAHIIGMIVLVAQDMIQGEAHEKPEEKPKEKPKTRQETSPAKAMTIILEKAMSWAFATLFDKMFIDWRPFRLLLEDPTISTMAEAIRRAEEEILPVPPLPTGRHVSDLWLPVPPGSPRIEMSACLVSNRQFKEFVEDPRNSYWKPRGGCRTEKKVDDLYLLHWRTGGGRPCDDIADLPVVNVSYCAAQAYARWRGAQLPKPLRLPRAEEWEQAARCGRSRPDWWEEDLNAGLANFAELGLRRPTGVSASRSNRWGFHDLLGNVSELCQSTEQATVQVEARGGSYRTPRHELLKAISLQPDECRPDVGFRCVADLASTSTPPIHEPEHTEHRP